MNISKHYVKRFKLSFTLNQIKAHKMQNNIPTVYISEIYCCIVKSTNLSTILQFCTKNMKNLKYRVVMATLKHEPAFSVGHFWILHVNLMFGKYWRGGEKLIEAKNLALLFGMCQNIYDQWWYAFDVTI
jgi:hypothetical protein